jgi:hypothetical protein
LALASVFGLGLGFGLGFGFWFWFGFWAVPPSQVAQLAWHAAHTWSVPG